MKRAAWIGVALAASLPACDLPPGSAHDGPVVVSVLPDPLGGAIDRSTSFRIELDRRVASGSVAQGVVEISSGDEYVWVDMAIDVVRPAVVVTPWSPLDPDVDYQLVVHGLRDLDGHTSRDTDPLVFRTSSMRTPAVADPITYDDVAFLFTSCAAAGCHSGSEAVLGLDLSSAAAVRATAVGVPAREVRASVGGYLQVDVSASMVGLPRIQSGNPARSYLLYTMLDDPHITGAPMPPSGARASLDELALLQRWIEAGTPGL